MTVHDLDTPAILIDLEILERNLDRLAAYAREQNLRLRPHTKTHKIPAIGRMQLDRGAVGLTVAKVGEAEVMLGARPDDLLLAYPVIGERKLARLMDVARRTRLTVALDSVECGRALSEAATGAGVEVSVLAEMDAGLGRVGVRPDEEIVALSRALRDMPGLRWRGIAFYPGHIKAAGAAESLQRLNATVHGALRRLAAAGLEPEIVSGGSTPTLWDSHCVRGVNEIRPGTYVFNDRNTVAAGACGWQDCAARIRCTVVSTSVFGQMIIDGGSKTFSSDRLVTGDDGFGRLAEAPDAVFWTMNEEHGYVRLGTADRTFQVGDVVHVIPNHICVAMNLHEHVYGVRGETVETVWKVEGRGRLQ